MDLAISVIVASYHPVWEKLKQTLVSILLQKDVTLQIIVVDDASPIHYFKRVKALFAGYHFTDFILLNASHNVGTCANVLRGVDLATGDYIKLISPGDYLYAQDTLCQWCHYLKKNNMQLCFGDAVYYVAKEKGISIVKSRNHPAYLDLYTQKHDVPTRKKDYLLLDDIALGASLLVERQLLQQYFSLLVPKVKYAEDHIYRMMIAQGIPLGYYPHTILWYEFGTGVSTSQNQVWMQRLRADACAANAILFEKLPGKAWFNLRYKCYLFLTAKTNRFFAIVCKVKYFLFPTLALFRQWGRGKPHHTPQNPDMAFYDTIMNA